MDKTKKDCSEYIIKLLEIGKKIAEKSKDPEIAKIIKERSNY